MNKCDVCGGEFRSKFGEMYLCHRHYMQMYLHGKITMVNHRSSSSDFIINNDCCEIILRNKNGDEIARTKIDTEDLDMVKDNRWCLNCNNYVHNGKIFLHNIILNKKNGYIIDHINHDILDNRKINLRYATRQQNLFNKLSKGIRKTSNNKWQAYINKNKKFIGLGSFINKEDAINARRDAEQKYFGEFAYQY